MGQAAKGRVAEEWKRFNGKKTGRLELVQTVMDRISHIGLMGTNDSPVIWATRGLDHKRDENPLTGDRARVGWQNGSGPGFNDSDRRLSELI